MCCTREASFATEDFWIHPEVAASDIFAALQARDPGVAQRAIAGPQNTAVSAVLNIRQLSPVTACYITISEEQRCIQCTECIFDHPIAPQKQAKEIRGQ